MSIHRRSTSPAQRVAIGGDAAPLRLPLTASRRARARALLGLGSSAQLLAALDDEDPLGLSERVHYSLRRGAWLVDPEALRRAALARIALHAPDWRGRPRLEVWLDAHIEAALADLVETTAYARFHRLPSEVRDVCCRALLDGEDPEALARAHCGDLSRLGQMLLLGLQALLEDSMRTLPESGVGPARPSKAAYPVGSARS